MTCGQENKDIAKACRKCGRDLAVPPAWFPDARWHLRTLGIIYAALAVFYFGVTALLKQLPRPYHLRDIPVEMTPWLFRDGREKHLPEEKLSAPPSPTLPPLGALTKPAPTAAGTGTQKAKKSKL